MLRAIKRDIENLPNTSVIAEEWDKYLGVLDERRRNKTSNGVDSDTNMRGVAVVKVMHSFKQWNFNEKNGIF